MLSSKSCLVGNSVNYSLLLQERLGSGLAQMYLARAFSLAATIHGVSTPVHFVLPRGYVALRATPRILYRDPVISQCS